jgi:tetratricopeptide (TPR) repeat protein
VAGNVVVRGTVGGKPYVQKYAIDLKASTAKGNAFVPRVWAALEIDRMETAGENTNRIVALSKGYGVLSKHTSLLVLESDAMFKAFGVDRAQPTMRWTGEDDAEVIGADAQVAYNTGGASKKSKKRKNKPAKADEARAKDVGASAPMMEDGFGGGGGGGWDPAPPPRNRRGGRWMKRVYYSVAAIGEFKGNSDKMNKVVEKFEADLIDNPDSREKHRALVQALSYTGDLKRAYEVATQWLERDKLDPQALTYMADILGRQGNRDDSLRLLSGIVDIDPDNTKLHTRLAEAYELAGDTEHACSHRTALAEMSDSAKVIGAAVRCQRALGENEAAEDILGAVATDKLRKKVDKAASIGAKSTKSKRNQLTVDATWEGGSDLDISIVTPQGTRLSWMGGRDGMFVEDTRDTKHEKLTLKKLKRGNYLIEVSRTKVGDTTPIAGKLIIRAHGSKRAVKFELTGDTAVVARLGVSMESRLEEVR